ncbi:MAG: PaaI family thioesterase [Candidatus Melainabacteria bacterium]|nr:PaaI family thioesterase [Candidatus Melainabacteria bacterium]
MSGLSSIIKFPAIGLEGLFGKIKRTLAQFKDDDSSSQVSLLDLKKLHHPFATSNGMELVEAKPGYIRAEVQTAETGEHNNSYGTVHGGYTTTMSDSAMAAAAQTLAPEGHDAVSAEIYKRFNLPVKPGEKLTVHAQDFGMGGGFRKIGAVVKNNDGRIVSIAGGQFSYQQSV